MENSRGALHEQPEGTIMSSTSDRSSARFTRFSHGVLLCVSAATVAVLAACSTPMAPKDGARFDSYASAADRPATRPVRSVTSFTDSLSCMDHMMRDAGTPTTLISSTFFQDYSGRIPVDTKDMVITALSQMSRLSNAFRYVDFEVNIVQQDTVQNLTTILLNTHQMQLQRPALYFSGGISFADQSVLSTNGSAAVSSTHFEAGYNLNRAATIIGLEMHLGDFRTRTFIPGMDSANEVVIDTSGQGLDVSAKIGAVGLTFNLGRNLTQGSGAAVRALAELGAIELVGKYTKLPYWRCLMQDSTNPEFRRQLREWYDSEDGATHARLIERYLVSQGYLAAQGEPRAPDSADLRQAIARFQADHGMVVTGVPDYTAYERAMRDFVAIGPDGNLERVGWPTGDATLSRTPLSVTMAIENPVRDRTEFAAGTQIFASATVSRSAYLYCYLQDANGNVVQLQPNMASPSALVSSNEALRLPDWMAPYPAYLLETGRQGREALMCIAADEDLKPRLPEALQAPPLTPVRGYSVLQQVKDAFDAAAQGRETASALLTWNVKPASAKATPADKEGTGVKPLAKAGQTPPATQPSASGTNTPSEIQKILSVQQGH